jgi:hypothetical protein
MGDFNIAYVVGNGEAHSVGLRGGLAGQLPGAVKYKILVYVVVPCGDRD